MVLPFACSMTAGREKPATKISMWVFVEEIPTGTDQEARQTTAYLTCIYQFAIQSLSYIYTMYISYIIQQTSLTASRSPYFRANHVCCTIKCCCLPTLYGSPCHYHGTGFSLPHDQFCMNWHCHSPQDIQSRNIVLSEQLSHDVSQRDQYIRACDLSYGYWHIHPAQQGFLEDKLLLLHWDLHASSIQLKYTAEDPHIRSWLPADQLCKVEKSSSVCVACRVYLQQPSNSTARTHRCCIIDKPGLPEVNFVWLHKKVCRQNNGQWPDTSLRSLMEYGQPMKKEVNFNQSLVVVAPRFVFRKIGYVTSNEENWLKLILDFNQSLVVVAPRFVFRKIGYVTSNEENWLKLILLRMMYPDCPH